LEVIQIVGGVGEYSRCTGHEKRLVNKNFTVGSKMCSRMTGRNQIMELLVCHTKEFDFILEALRSQ
jgi:hypothetical protein